MNKHEENIVIAKKALIHIGSLVEIKDQEKCLIEEDALMELKSYLNCSFFAEFADNAELSQNIFEKCFFDEIQLPGAWLKNNRINRCSVVNANFKKSKLSRTEFNGSKLLGTSFQYSTGVDLSVIDCNCQFADFRETKLKQTLFDGCILREADFQGADLRGVTFRNCDLREAQLSFAMLKGTSFCGSKIEGMQVKKESLRGAIVDYHQAAYLGTSQLELVVR